MPTKEKLIAANYSLEDMTEMLEVDSLGFLSVEGLYWAMGEKFRELNTPQYTDHCFTGDYPTPLIDRDRKLLDSTNQLSFLVEVA
jgi:amidophosphoribosyltransferase